MSNYSITSSSCINKASKTTLKAPFGWIGGKSRLARDIVTLMPNHTSYIEVFGGALSVFYAKEKSKIEIINDINSELINLHRVIKSNPQSLAIELNSMLKSREIFEDIKFKRVKPKNNIQKAAFYFYLISLSFGSKKEHFAMCKKNRSAKNIYRDFNAYSKRLKHAVIENLSYEKLIKEHDYKDALFYLDPPYAGTESYYKTGFNINNHKNLADILKKISGKFMLSYNDCEVVRDLYKNFNIKELKTTYSLNANSKNRTTSELLIMNF
ncbi:DNA adenine methylase [Campylobacter corcagiensis]|uniref:DNA adenine methylase n=1 Tax=Campylobacter corcagiensis TaxID=1448857 RepID=A0A7M1LFC7_9BACT|nr:DNA adenine methylase [Campylobacter corcagiensis]QKF64546.1 type II DNA methyltransferase [Campylobacter corcagiensis]QOQ87279.1 DNA adenine methylase [Campylobacter corcagiensis]